MKPFSRALAWFLIITFLSACGVFKVVKPDEAPGAEPTNLGFDQKGRGDFPASWGGGGRGYGFQWDVKVKRSGQASAQITSEAPYDPLNHSFGTITQCVDAEEYSTRVVSYSGFLKTENTTHEGAGLWLRAADKDDVPLTGDNMKDRRILGTQDWTRANIEIPVPEGVVAICFGLLLAGNGTAWADDLELSGK